MTPILANCDRCGHPTDTDQLAHDGLGYICGACHPVARVPKRIQLRRAAGWRKPEGVVNVARPTRWGNPFAVQASSVVGRPWFTVTTTPLRQRVGRADDEVLYTSHGAVEDAVAQAVDLFRTFCTVTQRDRPREFAAWLAPLRGHDLGCWCEASAWDGDRGRCHADVLLELAQEATA